MNNPLMAFQPHERVFVNLPTEGKFYKEGIITAFEDVGVLPMTAKDEMLLNNPDALMNGRVVTSLIKNCVPTVLDATQLAVADIEILLLAIKLASNDESYDINTKCPKCGKEGSFSRDIDELITTQTFHEDEYKFVLENKLTVYLKPNNWKSHSRLQQLAFKQHRLVSVGHDTSLTDEEKRSCFEEVFRDMVELNMSLVSDCVYYIETPDTKVYDPKFIREFVDTLSKPELKELSDLATTVNDIGVTHQMDVGCSGCDHEWTIEDLRFDPSHFFE